LDERRAFLVAQVLFERFENGTDVAGVDCGSAYPEEGPNKEDWPSFPISLENDIPFCMVEGYFGGANSRSIEAFLDRCEMFGSLRKAALNPTTTPLRALEALAQSGRWNRRFADQQESEKELVCCEFRPCGHPHPC